MGGSIWSIPISIATVFSTEIKKGGGGMLILTICKTLEISEAEKPCLCSPVTDRFLSFALATQKRGLFDISESHSQRRMSLLSLTPWCLALFICSVSAFWIKKSCSALTSALRYCTAHEHTCTKECPSMCIHVIAPCSPPGSPALPHGFCSHYSFCPLKLSGEPFPVAFCHLILFFK